VDETKFDGFIYGFFTAVIIVSLLLATQYGNYFNYLSQDGWTVLPSFGEALNWKSAAMLSLGYLLAYKNIDEAGYIRAFKASMFLAFAWGVSDSLWILKSQLMGNYLFGSQVHTYLSPRLAFIGYTRNLLMVLFAYPVVSRYLVLSWEGALSFTLYGLYWLIIFLPWLKGTPVSGFKSIIDGVHECNIHVILFYNPVWYLFNMLPFYTMLKGDISWRKFLFY